MFASLFPLCPHRRHSSALQAATWRSLPPPHCSATSASNFQKYFITMLCAKFWPTKHSSISLEGYYIIHSCAFPTVSINFLTWPGSEAAMGPSEVKAHHRPAPSIHVDACAPSAPVWPCFCWNGHETLLKTLHHLYSTGSARLFWSNVHAQCAGPDCSRCRLHSNWMTAADCSSAAE